MGLQKVLSKHLKPSQISTVYLIGGLIILVMGSVFLMEMLSPKKAAREERANVSNLITNQSRELGLDAVNQKVTQTSKKQRDLEREVANLTAANKDLSEKTRTSISLAREVESLKEVLKKVTEMQRVQQEEFDQKLNAAMNGANDEREVQKILGSGTQRTDTVSRLPVSNKRPNNPPAGSTGFSYGGNNASPEPKTLNQSQGYSNSIADDRTEQLFTIIENPVIEQDENQIYLPKAAILTGILITGLDAPTQADAQNQPVPVLIRLKKEAILPNYAMLEEVRECFALMAGYGELSSERANLRGESITCVRENGEVIEKSFGGYAVGEDGKAGLKGTLVSRNSTVLANAMMSGFASGMASMFNVNPVPVISTSSDGQQQYQDVFNTDAIQGGAAKGASEAMDKLADYYMKLADAMHPVIEVGAGRVIDIVITSGTNL